MRTTHSPTIKALWPLAGIVVLSALLLSIDVPTSIKAALLCVAYGALCLSYLMPKRAIQVADIGKYEWVVGYASQSGRAEQLALDLAQRLPNAQSYALNDLSVARLQSIQRLIVIASTYGDGEAPDNAQKFLGRLKNLKLEQLSFAVLGLGDAAYSQFCGFAKHIESALLNAQASRKTPSSWVDGEDISALNAWSDQFSAWLGKPVNLSTSWGVFSDFQLKSRLCLNQGSPGAPVFHLTLNSMTPQSWQAGDLLDVAIPTSSQTRCYSIANVDSSGESIELLVRQQQNDQGQLGLGSGYLTQQLQLNQPVHARLRSNPLFHAPDTNIPLILIGNGTGLAGLRSLLQERAQNSQQANWLIYGERTRQFDQHFAVELNQWTEQGVLVHCDLVFSRDGDEDRHVQHRLSRCRTQVLQWLDQGAAIYVCGSLEGMGKDVHELFVQWLGYSAVEALQAQGRYRRDLY